MANNIVTTQYKDLELHFTKDAWFNATEAAAHFGKRVDNWLRLDETIKYLEALKDILNTSDVRDLILTKKGKSGGTWLHPRLAVPFARWLDIKFSVWCDMQIDKLIRNEHPAIDWRRLRHASSASFNLMTESLKLNRECLGKDTKGHHYSNEARLVNWAAFGEFKGMNRDDLSIQELDLIAHLEVRNTLLISRGVEYEKRKTELKRVADEWNKKHLAIA